MGRASANKDPNQELLEELASAREEGKTELSVNIRSPEALAAVCQVTTLTDLRISGELTALPPEIGNLTQLTALMLENNKLTTLPREIGKLSKLEHFHVYSNQITSLPEEIAGMISLQKWVLWSNKLTTLPRGIGGLVKLAELELKWNQLARLPDEIARLENLENLDLESNALTDLPADLSGLKKLKRLKLAKNKLAQIPKGIFAISSLEELTLEENQIREIPPEIAKLSKLRELGLDKNQISQLPPELFTTSISVLHLSNNKLSEIPRGIGGMKQLSELTVEDNPIAGVPEAVLADGKDAIFEHLGLVTANLVSGDLPDEKTRAQLVKDRKEALDQFVRETRRKLTDEKMRDALMAFITGKSDKVPPGRLKDHYSFGHISNALNPHEKWNFIDRRIIAFITQGAWDFVEPGHDYETGYHDELFGWVKKQIEEEKDDQLFGKIAGELKALDKSKLVRRALIALREKLRHEDGRITSFGRWLVGNADLAAMLAAADEYFSVKEALVPMLMEHAPALFEKAAPRLLALTPNSDGEVHLPDEALRHLCKKDPARWRPLLDEGLLMIGDCLPCNADGCRILAECYPDARAEAFKLALMVLSAISERKNKEERFNFRWSGQEGYDDATASFIGWVLSAFGAEARPPVMKYVEDTKRFQIDVAEVVARSLGQDGLDMLAEGLNMNFDSDDIAPHFRRMFAILAPLDWSKYHDKAWELAQSEFKQVRETACLALGKLPGSLAKAKELLGAKKGHLREAGVMILGLIGTPEARALLLPLENSETNDDARDRVVSALYRTPQKIDVKEAERRVASAKQRGKLDKPVAKWLDEKKLPPLKWGKKAVDADTLRFLFYRQTRSDLVADVEARDVFPLIARDGKFADKLLQLIVKNGGASAKNRFALALVGLLGDDGVIEKLEQLAIEDRNLNAVTTLGLLGTREAARALDRIIRVFRVKYPNVRETAQDAFAAIADAMGLGSFELADAMLPDFGFVNHKRPLEAGKRALELVLGDDRKLAITEKGEVLKTPPKELTAKQKEELKTLATDIKEAGRQLKASLEYYLIIQRRWSAKDWKAFFVDHPLANAFARSLVWGVFDGKKLARAFTMDEAKSASGMIGLVHPLDTSNQWPDLKPPFAQMARPVFTVDAPEKTLSHQFEGKEVNSGTFKSRAERLGWRRGSVIDSGEVSAYRKSYPTDQIEVFVRIEGLNVQSYDFDGETTLQDFFFVKAGAVVTGSYTYDEPREAGDPRLIPFGRVPPIVYSETVADLSAIVKAKDDEE